MIYGNKTVQYAVYNRKSGTAKFVQDTTTVKRPSLEYLSDTISGAGILGEIEMPSLAQLGPITEEIGLRRTNPNAVDLFAPGLQEVEVRWVTDVLDTSTGKVTVSPCKEIIKGYAKSLEGGSLENNASQEGNLVLEVVYHKFIQDGDAMWEIDKLNNVFNVRGVDYAQDLRNNL